VDRRGFMAAAGGGFAASGFGIPVRAGTRETYHEIDSSHSPHITAPDALLALLLAQA
jgi:hypothetical protein